MTRFSLVLGLLVLAGCAQAGPVEGWEEDVADRANGLAILDENRPTTVDVGSWNLEWFGSEEQGPADEDRQLANAEAVLEGLNLDVMGLVEVVSASRFHAMVSSLPGRVGVLASDPSVEGGARYYGASEQKVALVVDERFQIERARLVLTDEDWAFGGRPPMEVSLRFEENGKPRTLVVIVVHLKAMSDAASYERRVASAAALKDFLDVAYPTRWVAVIGDFNDDLARSTHAGSPSPFQSFEEDPGRYRFTTQALSDAHVSTTVHFGSTIDHHLVTNELFARFVPGSAKVLRVDQQIEAYGTTTSDHLPVLTRYDLR